MPMTSKEIISLLQKNGFQKVSQNGSHIKLKNPLTNVSLIVPFHQGKTLGEGLEKAILKEAGLK